VLAIIDEEFEEVCSALGSGLRAASAGRENVALGDVVVGSYLHYAEFLKRGESGDLARYCGDPGPVARRVRLTAARARTISP
jgi:hypothetical protein